VNNGVPEVEGLEIAQALTGYPVSVIREDSQYQMFLKESLKINNDTSAVRPATFESNWHLSGAQCPTTFNLAVLRKNLELLKTGGELKLDDEAFWGAFRIIFEEMVNFDCHGFKELSKQEASMGTVDGELNPVNMKTSVGALMKMGDSKETAFEKNSALYVEIEDDDYDSIENEEREPLAWVSKTSLKDARMDVAKVDEGKGRIFQAQHFATSYTGRRLIGQFIARFMSACRKGGFFGVIGFILSRGGWHELLGELTNGFDPERVLETYPGDVSKFDKGWLYFWHQILVWLLALLCDDEILARKINRHYDRVLRAPTMLTIVGLIVILTKGQPSGDIATIIFNTIILVFNYCMAYCKVAPKSLWCAHDCFGNMILKAGGDDSISTLSIQMRKWLGSQPWEEVVRKQFADSGWTIVLDKRALIDAEFMGYGSTLADQEETGYKFLPALPFNAVMSIDQWRKFKKDKTVPMEIKDMMRYAAAAEKAFPHIWSRDPDAREYVRIAFEWMRRVRRQYWEHPCPEVRNAARGVPSVLAIAELYFGFPIPLGILNDRT